MLSLDKLNAEQYDAATHINGPLLILAGAGTGKTATITSRAAYMIEQGIAPEHILMLTFTNKAANEMKARLSSMLGEERGNNITACTFHSFCALMLRKYGMHIDLSPNFTILSPGDDEDIIGIVKSYKDKTRYSGRGFPPNSKVCGFISMSVNKNVEMSEVMRDTKYCQFVDEVVELAVSAAEYRRKNNLLNYDDILMRFIDLMNIHPHVAEQIAKTYQYIMVDELQDTNPLQEVILLELFRYTKNIAGVGDDMQSLYGFRGAEVENIINFPNKFVGCKTITLFKNYRSCQEILDLGNKVCECATEGFPKQLVGTYSSDVRPRAISINNQLDETDYVIELIQELHRQGIPYNEICIIERNSVLSAGIEVKLNKLGIDFDKYGGMKYTDLSYVKDVLAYLKVMVNPYDEIAWFRILQVHRGIGNANARRIAENCRSNGFDGLLNKVYSKRVYGKELLKLHDQLNLCDGMKPCDMVKSFITFYCETNKLNIEMMDTDEGSRTSYLLANENQRNELQKLIEIASSYKNASSFLDDLLLDNTNADKSQNGEHVIISTVHSVKGLEFDAVIILDCVDGIFPNAEEEGSKDDNEELRCFYVAVTRARKRLYLMCPRAAMRYGKSLPGTPSRYLKDAQGIVHSNDYAFFNRFDKESDIDFTWRRKWNSYY
jgi:DNA helicase-2/ATP-dependent DNA helicase PcrA